MIALVLSLADFLYSLLSKPKTIIDDDDDVAIFDLPRDAFNGVTLDTAIDADGMGDATFRAKLAKSLHIWRETEVCAVTIYIRLPQSSFVPICASFGFEFHHARPEYVFMLKWLPVHRPSKFPGFANTMVGVGGLVINENEKVLVVQERYLYTPHWKLPGGLADPGEDVPTTAIREVLEETGIETEFVCILAFRHMHTYHFGCSDFYFVCLLRPLRRGLGNQDIVREETEISQCRWMPIDEYVSSPLVSQANSFIAERYLLLRSGNFAPADDHPIPNGIEPFQLPQLVQQNAPLPQQLLRQQVSPQMMLPQHQGLQNHFNGDPDDASIDDGPIVNHDQLLNLEPRAQPPAPPLLPGGHFGFGIVQTPVPSYNGANTNLCYSVGRIDLNQI